MKICLLGWGSLLWDIRPDFDNWHENWDEAGPDLKLEFSRISKSRLGALTLVIDNKEGTQCRVSYAMSKRRDPDDAISDLRCREGTILKNIGVIFLDRSRADRGDQTTIGAIREWAEKSQMDVVIWTALTGNFQREVGKPFSTEAALSYLKTLSPEGKAKAAEYVWRAPRFVATPLREQLQGEPWFPKPD